MNSPKGTSLARLPRSGDKLVDWIFKQFVFYLRRETMRIRRKRRLVLEDDPKRELLAGLLNADRDTISINPAKSVHKNRDEELITLIHELSHLVFSETRERFIDQIEGIILRKLTQEQKEHLKSFIPRHEVKTA
jgi:hypothetical protein